MINSTQRSDDMQHRHSSRWLLTCVLLVLPGSAKADFLTGSVSFSPSTRLYTYSYTLDDRAAPAPLDQIYVLIDPGQFDFSLKPLSQMQPASWGGLFNSVGGPVPGPVGTFFGWNENGDWRFFRAGRTDGFSFTTSLPPSRSTADNYFLFSTQAGNRFPDSGGDISVGHTVAPDYGAGALQSPEPSGLALAGAGLVILLVAHRVRRRWWRPAVAGA
jgi:hypothetical protein